MFTDNWVRHPAYQEGILCLAAETAPLNLISTRDARYFDRTP